MYLNKPFKKKKDLMLHQFEGIDTVKKVIIHASCGPSKAPFGLDIHSTQQQEVIRPPHVYNWKSLHEIM